MLDPCTYTVMQALEIDDRGRQHSRALLRPQFSRSQVADLKLEETHVQNLFSRLETQSDSWTSAVDLAPLFFNLTLDSATEFLFGESVQSQLVIGTDDREFKSKGPTRHAELDVSSFGKSFDRANTVVTYRGRLFDFYFLYCPRYFGEDCAAIQRFADHYVNLALKGELKSSADYVFLRELAKETRDPKELRSQLLNVLLAGRDTTAGLLGWTFYILARHPDVYSKLRAVILETFGPLSSNVDLITFESLKSCAYLQNVLSEVLRLHPVVPENGRRAVRNTTLPRGGGPDGLSPIYIPAGEEVGYNVHMMHHRKDLWGEDADEFRPDRWIGRRPGWEFLPFNGGPRICLGQQFALTEAGYVIVRIVQRFDKMDNLDTSTVTKHVYTSTTAPVQVLVRMHEASE